MNTSVCARRRASLRADGPLTRITPIARNFLCCCLKPLSIQHSPYLGFKKAMQRPIFFANSQRSY